MGDHRGPHVVSLNRESILGTTDPSPAARTGRNVQAKIPRIRKPYNNTLERLCKRHKMLPKLTTLLKRRDEIVDTDDCSPEKADLKRQIEKWDEEHVQFKKAAERGCRKIKVGRIPYTPEVGEWVKRKKYVLIRLEKYHVSRQQGLQSKIKMKSLKEACRSANLPMPQCTRLVA